MCIEAKIAEQSSLKAQNKGLGILPLALGLLALIVGAVIAVLVTTHSKPKLQVSPRNVYLGNLLQYHEGTADIKIKNSVGSPIRIDDIQPTCGCTQFSIDRRFIDMGHTSTVHVTVNAENNEGRFKVQLILIWSTIDGKTSGKETILFRGVSGSVLRLSKGFIDLSGVDANAKDNSEQIAVTPGTSGLKWNTLTVTSQDGADIETRRVTDRKWMLTYTIHPDHLPIGTYHDRIQITPENNGYPIDGVVQIPVVGSIGSDFRIDPQALYLGRLNSTISKKGIFKIESGSQSPLEFLSVSAPKYLLVNLVAKDQHSLVLSFQTVPNAEFDQGDKVCVKICTDRPRTVEVPVLAFK